MFPALRWLAIASALTGCALVQDAGPKLPAPPQGFVLAHEFVELLKGAQPARYLKVQYGWDYACGCALRRTFELDGRLISSEPQPDLSLSAAPSELQYAFALVRAQPELAPLLNRADARFYGGFAVRGAAEPNCGRTSRCLHVMVSGGAHGELRLAHVIVDLATRRIAQQLEPSG